MSPKYFTILMVVLAIVLLGLSQEARLYAARNAEELRASDAPLLAASQKEQEVKLALQSLIAREGELSLADIEALRADVAAKQGEVDAAKRKCDDLREQVRSEKAELSRSFESLQEELRDAERGRAARSAPVSTPSVSSPSGPDDSTIAYVTATYLAGGANAIALYDDFIYSGEEMKRLSKSECIKANYVYESNWPSRQFSVLSLSKNGASISVIFEFHCLSRKGKQSHGFSHVLLILNEHSKITTIIEKTSKSPLPDFPGFIPVDLNLLPPFLRK